MGYHWTGKALAKYSDDHVLLSLVRERISQLPRHSDITKRLEAIAQSLELKIGSGKP